MRTKSLVVRNPNGLHTRPGTLFVEEAMRFDSAITVAKGEKTANGKSLIKLLRIGISCGDNITIRAEGPDEDTAVEAMAVFVERLAEMDA